jgi:peptide deformylase
MAIRNIVCEGDDILKKRAKEVTEINEKIIMLLDDMAETMKSKDGVGLAANQVGMLKRIFIADVGDGVIELINPEILEIKGSQFEEEGCLSVPGLIGKVQRPEYVKITGLNRKGKQITLEGTELLARVFCHETDHLNGELFIDKAKDIREAEENEEYE